MTWEASGGCPENEPNEYKMHRRKPIPIWELIQDATNFCATYRDEELFAEK